MDHPWSDRIQLIGFSLPTVTVTATSLVDAVPISSPPAGLPTPIPGYYTIPLQNTSYQSDECVQDPREAHTWDCTGGALMELSITIVDSDPVVLFNFSDNDGPWDPTVSMVRYGAQPPILDGYTTMSLMNATDHLEKGPAYVFHRQFNKLVILPGEAFEDTMPSRRRQNVGYEQYHNFSEGVYAAPGEKPWFCYWNGTLLEGFIFVTQVLQTQGTVAKRADTDNVGYSDNYDDGWDSSSKIVYHSQTPAVSSTSLVVVRPVTGPSSLIGASAIMASSTPIPEPPGISVLWPIWSQESASAATSASEASASAASVSEAPPSEESASESGLAVDGDDARGIVTPVDGEVTSDFAATFDRYPTVIKIEERRDLENQAQPYCQQMLIMGDRSVQSIADRRIDLTVAEFAEIHSRRSRKRSSNMRKREDDYGCQCAWILDGPLADGS